MSSSPLLSIGRELRCRKRGVNGGGRFKAKGGEEYVWKELGIVIQRTNLLESFLAKEWMILFLSL